MKPAIRFLINFLILAILFSGCKSVKEIPKEELYGKYQLHTMGGIASTITLKKDEKFYYSWNGGLIWGDTNGTWVLKNNTLILNSEKQPEDEKKSRITSTTKTDSDHYEIKIMSPEKYPLAFTSCILMNGKTIVNQTRADSNGVCLLPILDEANKLVFKYLTGSVEIPIESLAGNSFTLEMKYENDYYRYFTNREWKIKDGRIIDPKIKRSKYTKRNYYEKVVE